MAVLLQAFGMIAGITSLIARFGKLGKAVTASVPGGRASLRPRRVPAAAVGERILAGAMAGGGTSMRPTRFSWENRGDRHGSGRRNDPTPKRGPTACPP